MHDASRLRRLVRGCAAIMAVGVLVAAPGALAQTDDPVDDPEVDDPNPDDPEPGDAGGDPGEEDPAWSESRFDEPLASSPAVLERSSFPISGTFVHAIYDVTEVHVDFGRPTGDGFSDADGDACVPGDPANPVAGPQAEDADGQRFAVDGITWPCNGEFAIRARARAQGSVRGSSEHVMRVLVSLHAPPPPVASVDASVDGSTVTVSWTAQDPSPDAAGYRIERAGPKADGDAYGSFEEVGSVATDASSIDDTPAEAGDFRYRVRALRDSAGGLESPVEGTAVADVSVGSAADTPPSGGGASVATDRGGRRSSVGVPRSGSNRRLPSGPPTTLDTGFETEIDYGDRDRALDDDSDELASEGGQSVIRTEGDGVGMMAPAAGALVLLGWAGHIVYLNRLAKQF